ncbi:MAG: 50S ribosomal protein L21 [Candidatus Marinimicrobia bacterium]|nr:50S ribosomal protein L21 [Candidatus Neomarinimicrobiota bacterium]
MKRENYAIAEIAGKQVILEPGKKLRVPKLNLEEGAEYTADKILYLRKGDVVTVGQPYLEDSEIKTTVVGHDREAKVIIFKKKRRKRYDVKKGHRQHYTLIKVEDFAN